MLTNIFDFLLIIGAIQGFVFIIIPLFLKRKIEKPVWLLSGIVLSISLNNIQAWLIAKKITTPFLFIENLELPWYMLATPFFFAFIIHFLNIQHKVKDLLKLFSTLFLLEICARIIIIVGYHDKHPNAIKIYSNFEEIINVLIAIYLFSKAAHIVFRQNELFKEITLLDDIHWIKQFIILGFFIILFWVMAVIANNYFPSDTNHIIYYYPLRLGSSFLMYWIGYQGLIHYNLLQDRISLRKRIDKEEQSTNHSIKEISDEKQKESFKKIENYLINHKRYLDPVLSLSVLAKEQDISISHLSKLINTYGKSSFSDYVNQFRVERAKVLLSNENYKNYTNIAIGFECGFNSKSTFYTSFKKFTSMTPNSYREKFLNKKNI